MSPVSHVRVPFKKLSPERLDIGFYTKEYFEALSILESSNINIIDIGDITEPWCFGAYALCNSIVWSNSNEGLPYIKAEALGSPLINFDGLTYITKETHQLLTKSQLKAGDIIVSTSGTIGLCAVIPDSIQVANSNQDTIKFNPSKKGFDNYFVVAWIASKYGQIILKREAGGAIQQHIYLSNFRRIPLLNPDRLVQNYIGDKVRLAEKLRERSKESEIVIKEKMQECFAGNPKPRPSKHNTVIPDLLTANRLEYDFYKPLAIWAYEEIRGSQWQYKKLVDVASRIKDGPGGWGVSTKDYVDSGVPVIRAINLINGECDLSDCIFISDKKHQELASHKVNSNSVLLSVRGTIGRAAIFYANEYKEANLNAAVVTIDCKNDVLPEFLAEFLNTEVGRIQSQRMANGAVQLNMNLEETGNNLIVIPPKIFQEKITNLRRHRLLIEELSEKLTTAAKYLVEALIEGELTETELKNAQTALQKGENEPDRAILTKLTRKGYDIADEPPLFPDLDAVYQATREIDL